MSVQIDCPKARTMATFAVLLEYPRFDYFERVAECKSTVELFCVGAANCLSEFGAAIEGKSIDRMEELYTRTFDMAPLCNPYLTTYLYGDENFERGNLMTMLAERYARASFNLHGELPDHVAVLLKFAPQFDTEELNDLVEFCLLGPLQKMSDCLREADSVYYPLIKAVLAVLTADEKGDCTK